VSAAAVLALVLVVVVTVAAAVVRVKGPDQPRRRSRQVSRSFAAPADAGAESMAVPRDGQIGPSA